MRLFPITFAVCIGALYGVLGRWVFTTPPLKDIWVLMSIAFLFVVPFSLGALTVALAEGDRPLGLASQIFLPWASTAAALAAAVATGLEGVICVILISPIGFFCSSIGGVIAGFFRNRKYRVRRASILAIVLTPYLAAPLERLLPVPVEVRAVYTTIEIGAAPSRVWEEIARVRPIGEHELRTTWIHRIGFPKPVEAVLASEGVGAVRKATFRGGIEFTETVTAWLPERTLAFSIKANTDTIPATSLDSHVTIGGDYFDVLRGEYRIERLDSGPVLLHLTSWHRVSTTFNWYAAIWSSAVIADIQQTILEVIKRRSEASPVR